MKRVLFCCVLSACWLTTPPAQAVEIPFVTLVREAELSFSPSRVFFLVAPGGGELLRRVPGVFEPYNPEDPGQGKYLLAASLPLMGEDATVPFAVVVVGENEQLKYFAPERKMKETSVERLRDVQKLQEDLSQIRKEVVELKIQKREKSEEVERLRGDATVIARLERVEALEARMAQLQKRIDAIDSDIQNLNAFLNLTRKQEEPRNFARRERELIRQLKLLADASQTAESNETGRLSLARSTMQQKLRLIEASRALNEQQLYERLEKARERRMVLERKYGRRVPRQQEMQNPEDYLQ
jgi:hypothetical protein